MRLFSQRRFGIVYVAIAALGTIAGTLAMPVVTSSFATCPSGNVEDGNCVSGSQTTINVNLQPTIGLTVTSATVKIESALNDTTVSQGSTAARVTTNNEKGYKLYISTPSTATSQALTKAGTTRQIFPSAGTRDNPVSTSNFVVNTWGVTGGDLTGWIGVPSYANQATSGLIKTGKVKTTSPTTTYGPTTDLENAGGYDEVTLTFGTKLDTTLPAGEYTGTVLLTAVVVE